MTLERIQLARRSILARLAADHRRQARLMELQTKFLVSAAHGANGSKLGQKAADGVQFLADKREPRMASFEDVVSKFGGLPEEG